MPTANVLFIDDRPEVAAYNKARLEAQGYSVATASSGYHGIRILEQRSAAVVLLEYRPGSLDAEAVAYLIKRRFPSQPVVLLSAFSDMPQRILWLVDDYAPKSAMLDELVLTIERVAGRQNA